MKRSFLPFICLGLSLSLFTSTSSQAEEKLSVLGTTEFVADWVRQVAGEEFVVGAIISGDADPHTFSPSPRDMEQVNKAKTIFSIGLGYESWLNALKPPRVEELSKHGVDLLDWQAGEKKESHDHGHHHHHHHEDHAGHEHHKHHDHEADPHFWTDVEQVRAILPAIVEILSELKPDSAEAFQANAQAYDEVLAELGAGIGKSMQAVSPEQRIIVTGHHSFAYFARRYGFEHASPLGTSTDTLDPAAGRLGAMLKFLEARKPVALFSEDGDPDATLESLSRESGIPIADEPILVDGFATGQVRVASYVEMMEHNSRVFLRLLSAAE
ncbi:MAG: metal ABC transporter substrate-binding protein [Verrucomicrobiales bacterium]